MTKDTKTAARTAKENKTDRIAKARDAATEIGGAYTAVGKAYVSGVLQLGRTLGGYGREILTEAGGHARETVKARSLREVAELQAGYAQHRIEMAATHTKEFIDLTRAKSEEAIEPLADLLRKYRTA